MMKFKVILIILIFQQTTGSLIGDFISSAKLLWPQMKETSLENNNLPQIDFEIPNDNDEFIKQGLDILKKSKSELDICSHHVILNLKKNCNQLTLEEIGKLAIMLMNCQFQEENRPKYPCKPEMSMQQCTMGMDHATYQIYQIMTHRAVGICGAIKQDQFKAQTEITVNRLAQVTQDQQAAIKEALQNQRRINEMGQQNIREYEESYDKIKDKQMKTIDELSKTNYLVEEIYAKIQREIELQKKSEEQMKAIDRSTSEMIEHYQEALQFFNSFKSVMSLATAFSNNVQNIYENFRGLMKEIGIEVTAEFFLLLAVNLGYLIMGMIFIIFLDLGSTFKSILISLSIFNALAAYYKAEVPIAGTNFIIWSFHVIFFKFLPKLKSKVFNFSFSLKFPKLLTLSNNEENSDTEYEILSRNSRARSSTPISEATTSKDNTAAAEDDSEMADIFANPMNSTIVNKSKSINRPETPLNSSRPMTPAMLRVMNSETSFGDRSATPFMNQNGRIQCQALTTKGLQCKNAAVTGSSKCRVHNFN